MEKSAREQLILTAIADAEKVRGLAFETKTSLEAIEGARQQLSAAQDEIRGQTTTIKDRVTWLIRELDRLAEQFKQLKDAPK